MWNGDLGTYEGRVVVRFAEGWKFLPNESVLPITDAWLSSLEDAPGGTPFPPLMTEAPQFAFEVTRLED